MDYKKLHALRLKYTWAEIAELSDEQLREHGLGMDAHVLAKGMLLLDPYPQGFYKNAERERQVEHAVAAGGDVPDALAEVNEWMKIDFVTCMKKLKDGGGLEKMWAENRTAHPLPAYKY